MKLQRIVAPLLLGPLACAVLFTGSPAQDEQKKELEVGRWYPIVESGITLTQGTYSKNWAGGDKGSIIWTFITNAGLQNQLSSKVNWNNTLKLAYGQTHQQSIDPNRPGERVWDGPEKSTDLLNFETIFRFTLGAWVDPFVAGQFESQFQDASDPYGRTLALNPLKFSQSAGVARHFVNQEDRQLLSRIGLSMHESIRKIFTDSTTTRAQSEATNDAGLEWVTEGKTKILEDRVAWTSKLTVYQPFMYSARNDFEDALGRMSAAELAAAGIPADAHDYTVQVNTDWENIFTSQITKLLSVTLYTRWVYDKYDNTVKPLIGPDGKLSNPTAVRTAIRPAGQFKETLSIGITYRIL